MYSKEIMKDKIKITDITDTPEFREALTAEIDKEIIEKLQEVLPAPEGVVCSGHMRKDTLDGTSRYFKNRFKQF
jgi:hypothetical protein